MRKIYFIFAFGAIFAGCGANAAPMTAQIRDLIQQKEEKIKKLEECEGKTKGWRIAGISTIGVTAVGVVGNIVLANKNSELTNEIAASQRTLDTKKAELSELQQQAAEKERKKNETERIAQPQNQTGNVAAVEDQKENSATNNQDCSCPGCKKTLNINKTNYTCGSRDVSENTLAADVWLYICNNGCWKGVDTVDYRRVPNCTDEEKKSKRLTPWIAGLVRTYDYYSDVIDGSYFDIKSVCKVPKDENSVVTATAAETGTATVVTMASRQVPKESQEARKTSFRINDNFQGFCQKPFNDDLVSGNMSAQRECNSLTRGDWVVWNSEGNSVHGKSMCAKAGAGLFNQIGSIPDNNLQAAIQDEYDEWVRGGRYSYTNNFATTSARVNCYCQVDGENTWVFVDGDSGMSGCEPHCALLCAKGGKLV